MPRKTVWGDFVVNGTYMKAVSQHGKKAMVEYTRFVCPYSEGCCGLQIETPSTHAVNNKSNACKHHLMNCHGTSPDGRKASEDPRVVETRVTAVGTAVSCGESAVIATLQAHHAEQMQAQQKQHEELMAALSGRLEKKSMQLTATYSNAHLSPPRSDDDDDAVKTKVGTLEETSKLKFAARVMNEVGASPPRDGESADSALTRGLKRCAEEAQLDVCGICFTRPPDTVMMPCFCLSACGRCWNKWTNVRLQREGRRPRCTKCNGVVTQSKLINRR